MINQDGYSPNLNVLFAKFSFFSFTEFEKLILEVPNTLNKNAFKYYTNISSASTKKITYLAIPRILSANSGQTHHTLVTYLKVGMISSGAVCRLLI